jgi:hypothetical protein
MVISTLSTDQADQGSMISMLSTNQADQDVLATWWILVLSSTSVSSLVM